VAFFERLGWYRVGDPALYVGRLHQQMAVDLQNWSHDRRSMATAPG
jgi:hypothetical protein